MNNSKIINADAIVLTILGAILWFIYSRYYNHLVFGDPSVFINQSGPGAEALPEGSSFRINVPGFEGSLLKFFLIHSAPFIFAAFYFRDWNLKRTALLSLSIWFVVYLTAALFRANEFTQVHQGGEQCLITAVSTYPLMAICMVTGHVIGKSMRLFRDSVAPQSTNSKK